MDNVDIDDNISNVDIGDNVDNIKDANNENDVENDGSENVSNADKISFLIEFYFKLYSLRQACHNVRKFHCRFLAISSFRAEVDVLKLTTFVVSHSEGRESRSRLGLETKVTKTLGPVSVSY